MNIPNAHAQPVRRVKATGNVHGNVEIPGLNKGNMYVNNGNNVPNYPGETLGITAAEAKALYDTNVRSLGFSFSGGTTENPQKIDLPGDARVLIGLASLNGAWGTVSLKLNGLDLIEDTDTGFTKIGDNKEYYRINLPITGRDSLKLTITGYAPYANQPFIFLFI